MNTQTAKSRLAALLLILLLAVLPSSGVAAQDEVEEEDVDAAATFVEALAILEMSHAYMWDLRDFSEEDTLYGSYVKEYEEWAILLEDYTEDLPKDHPWRPTFQKRAGQARIAADALSELYEAQAEERRGLRNRTLLQKLGRTIRGQFREAVGLAQTVFRRPGRAIRLFARQYVRDRVKKILPDRLARLNSRFDAKIAQPVNQALVRKFGPELGAELQKVARTWFVRQRDGATVSLRKFLEEEGILAKKEEPEDKKPEDKKTEGETTEGETAEGETSEDEGYEFEEPTDAEYDEVGGEDGEGPDQPAEEEAEPEDTSSATYDIAAWFPKSELDSLCGRFASIAPDYEAGLHSAYHVEKSNSWVVSCHFQGPGYRDEEANVDTLTGFLVEIHVYETDAQAQQFAVAEMCFSGDDACTEDYTRITECLADNVEDPAACSSAFATYEQTEHVPSTLYSMSAIGSVLNAGFYIAYTTPDEAQSRDGVSAALAEAIKIVQEKREQTR